MIYCVIKIVFHRASSLYHKCCFLVFFISYLLLFRRSHLAYPSKIQTLQSIWHGFWGNPRQIISRKTICPVSTIPTQISKGTSSIFIICILGAIATLPHSVGSSSPVWVACPRSHWSQSLLLPCGALIYLYDAGPHRLRWTSGFAEQQQEIDQQPGIHWSFATNSPFVAFHGCRIVTPVEVGGRVQSSMVRGTACFFRKHVKAHKTQKRQKTFLLARHYTTLIYYIPIYSIYKGWDEIHSLTNCKTSLNSYHLDNEKNTDIKYQISTVTFLIDFDPSSGFDSCPSNWIALTICQNFQPFLSRTFESFDFSYLPAPFVWLPPHEFFPLGSHIHHRATRHEAAPTQCPCSARSFRALRLAWRD